MQIISISSTFQLPSFSNGFRVAVKLQYMCVTPKIISSFYKLYIMNIKLRSGNRFYQATSLVFVHARKKKKKECI